MKYVLKFMLISRYGWRWAIVRVSDREVIKHRRLHVKALADLREMSSELEYVYEGRSRPKLSVLSATRRMESAAIPVPALGEIERVLYPQRSDR